VTSIEDAVEVSTGVTIDWEELGRAYGELMPNDQALFLLGMWEATTDNTARHIANAVAFRSHTNANRAEVAEFLHLLATAIDVGPRP
jgi:hypothetical protein